MKQLYNGLVSLAVVLTMILVGALIFNGVDHIDHTRFLKKANTNSTELVDKINGCLVVYETCSVEVVGSHPRKVDGVFNGVIVK